MSKDEFKELQKQITQMQVELGPTYDEAEASRVFVEHIRRHLKPNQDVVCKICGKTVQEIWVQHCKETEQEQGKKSVEVIK